MLSNYFTQETHLKLQEEKKVPIEFGTKSFFFPTDFFLLLLLLFL